MTIHQLLDHLRSLDVQLWVEDDRLRFSSPEGRLTPSLRADIATYKREMMDMLIRQAIPPHTPLPAIWRASGGTSPLSFAQQRLWFVHQLTPNNPAYTIPIGLRLRGSLDLVALEQSINAILERHEALRTTFTLVDDAPVQVIHAPIWQPVTVIDLECVPQAEREAAMQQRILEATLQPFDLQHGPLLRTLVLRLSRDEHVLLITVHHIVFDGWSLGILIQELVAYYEAERCQQPLALSALSIRYTDYALWQRQRLQGPLLAAQFDYWRRQLADAPSMLELPTDRPRPAVQRFTGALEHFTLSRDLTERLRCLSRDNGATLFMTLLAAWQVLLYRYSGQTDLCVGTPIAGRTHRELEGLIGLFVNTLVLRTNLGGEPDFQALLARVRDVTLDAYMHQELPFEAVVDMVQPQRSRSHSPLFQVMFAMQNMSPPVQKLATLQIEAVTSHTRTAKFDLMLALSESADGLTGELEYDTDLFDSTTITRLIGHLQTMLTGIADTPNQPISQLTLLTPAERQQVLDQWNATATPTLPDQCLHEWFEEQAARTPDAPAVRYASTTLSYRQLNERANQLAHHLRQRGVQPETIVGVCLERSVNLVVALLAVLKAGGAYVPLDPTYPIERLRFMLQDAHAAVLLTDQQLQQALTDGAAAPAASFQVVCPEQDALSIDRESIEPLRNTASADHPAYVIYTSGSTGQPKGVVITHRAIVNHMRWMGQTFPLEAQDKVLQKTPISFDASVWEFYAPLLAGAQLVLARPDGHQDPAYLVELIQAEGVTVLQMVPSLLQMLIEQTASRDCHSLRRVYCGGEPLTSDLVMRAQAQLNAPVYNLYGPTETTIEATYWDCSRPTTGTPVPIGQPIDNMQVYVLDAQMQPVPIGVAGELYIGGAGLARGYLRRPALTAERFVPNPFCSAPGARLYRTGDRARFRPDGAIEYLGRIDQQIKLRGLRIELQEIEAAIQQHPTIQQAAVIVREDTPGDQRLVAYIVQAEPGTSDLGAHQAPGEILSPGSQTHSDLRAFLKQRLPEYMLPAFWIMLPALPLTANGKVDRRALPVPTTDWTQRADSYVLPRDTLEHQLATIWAAVLNVAQISIHDNFFELGGNSLLSIRLVKQIQQHLHAKIPVQRMFEAPTIAQLAQVLRRQVGQLQTSSLVELQPKGSRSPLFWVHPIGGTVFCYLDLAQRLGPDQPSYGLQAAGLEGEPHADIPTMAAHYIRELQARQPHGPYHLGGWSMGGLIAFEIAQQLCLHGEQVALLVMIDTARSQPEAPHDNEPLAQLLDFAYDLGLSPQQLAGTAESLDEARARFQLMDTNAQLSHILNQGQLAGLLPIDLDLSYIRQLFSVFTVHRTAVQHYVPQRYQGDGDVLFFEASVRDNDTPLNLQAEWIELVTDRIEAHQLAGDHYSLLRRPTVETIAEVLHTYLMADQAELQT